MGEPVQLPREVLAVFPELAEARYRRGGLAPRVGGWLLGARTVAGITLWNTVFLAVDGPVTAELLLHELAHVRQFQASRTFPVRYLWESVRVGYRRNPYEVAARRFAAARLRAARSSSPSSGT